MIVSVNIEGLLDKNLTLEEYFVLSMLNSKDFELLDRCVKSEKAIISLETIDSLETKGYIKITSERLEWSKIGLRQPFYGLFDTSSLDKKFAELYGNYPMKVPDGRGGYRVLRAKGFGTTDFNICKEKYMRAIKGKPELPDRMLKALNKHLEMQRGQLQYMPGFEVWLNKRMWEKYDAFIDEKAQQEERNIERI